MHNDGRDGSFGATKVLSTNANYLQPCESVGCTKLKTATHRKTLRLHVQCIFSAGNVRYAASKPNNISKMQK
jgi:hypothetical protein